MEDLVPVLVPKSRVLDVYALLSRPVAPSGDVHTPEKVRATAAGRDPWPSETLERAYRESSLKMRKLLDHLADNAGRAVPIGELGEAIGYGPYQVAGTLGAAGRRITNRYHLGFPFAWEKRPEDGVYTYTMNEEDAAVIRGLRTDR
jgi:hypothetical protein